MYRKQRVIKIEGALKLNPADYRYMHKLSLEGFLWEFIRRNAQYRNIYSEFQTRSINPSEMLIKFRELRKKVAIRPQIVSCEEEQSEHFLWFEYPHTNLSFGLPNPDVTYDAFSIHKPIIMGMTPVIPYKIDADKIEKKSITSGGRKILTIKDACLVPKEHCYEIINEILPPLNVKNTLYIGIAMTADKNDIMNALEGIVTHLVEERKITVKKKYWKTYLFIYDQMTKLREVYPQISYTDFINEFTSIYDSFRISAHETVRSSDYFNENKCGRYYKKAHYLINEGYKKYLYLK